MPIFKKQTPKEDKPILFNHDDGCMIGYYKANNNTPIIVDLTGELWIPGENGVTYWVYTEDVKINSFTSKLKNLFFS